MAEAMAKDKKLSIGRREIDWLAGALGFNSLPDRPGLVGLLSRMASIERLRPAEGSAIIGEGQQGSDFFIIYAGHAVVEKEGRPVAELVRGDFFGEISFLTGAPRSATVRAAQDCEIFRMKGEEFDRIVKRVPGLEAMMRDTARERIRKLSGRA